MFAFNCNCIIFIYVKWETNKRKMESDYKVSTFNNGELFAVTSERTIYGRYYRSKKAAEKHLYKVRIQAGETIVAEYLAGN